MSCYNQKARVCVTYSPQARTRGVGVRSRYMKKAGHAFHTCPDCGANLDPGEKCDCTDEATTNKKDRTGVRSVCDGAES